MELRTLRLSHFRLFTDIELELSTGWSMFIGANGAGKTTLLEAAFLLSHGRSFRRGPNEVLVQRGEKEFSLFGRMQKGDGSEHRLGLACSAGRLEARADGMACKLSELIERNAAVCFEPNSRELISGGAEGRRQYLDWGVFHVEQEFLLLWRRYQRALRQRNALLKQECSAATLEPWDAELIDAGMPITNMRQKYIQALQPQLMAMLARFLPELGAGELAFDVGWNPDGDLKHILQRNQERDRTVGYTTAGPHRANWVLRFELAPRHEHLSRGQEKLCALSCILAQAQLYAKQRGEWPVICLDDVSSELDASHQQQIITALAELDAQVLFTGTELLPCLKQATRPLHRFHVEPGQVRHLL